MGHKHKQNLNRKNRVFKVHAKKAWFTYARGMPATYACGVLQYTGTLIADFSLVLEAVTNVVCGMPGELTGVQLSRQVIG
jgi:hypothetical protein